MALHADVLLHPDQDLYFASKIFCGLRGMEQRRELTFRIVKANPWHLDGLTLGMILRRDSEARKVAFDFRDRSDLFHRDSLEECDVYFKRGYYFPDVDQLSPELASKVHPFGLTYACRGNGITPLLLSTLFPDFALRSLEPLFGRPSRFRSTMAKLSKFLASPASSAFEMAPSEATEPVVLFQTRVWSPSETTDDYEDINESRTSLVRALRRAFGSRFWGGLVPTPYAQEKYPDLVTPFSSRRSEYIAMTRRARVAVYSRGLHFSNACKLPEYLASSKAIVSDCLRQELPEPLREGMHFLDYNTPEECVERCAELLRDETKVQEMREAAYDYYLKEVEPIRHLRNRIEQAFSLEPATVRKEHAVVATAA